MTLTGVVCDDRPEVRRAVAGVLTRCGFQAVEVGSYAEMRDRVREVQPTVIVLTLPVVGISSLAVVGTLLGEAPASEIVVLSAFQQLHLAAIKAGARALVPEEDPASLQAVLLQIAEQQEGAVAAGRPRHPLGDRSWNDQGSVGLRLVNRQFEHET